VPAPRPAKRDSFATTVLPGTGGSTGSLVGALANEKTPLRDTAAPTPKRAQKTADRSTVARRRIVIGVVAAVAVLGLLWLLFGRGENSPLADLIGVSSTPPPPEFKFDSVSSKPEATAAHLDKKKLAHAAKTTEPAIQRVLTQVLQAGYVDPDTWGDAGAIADLFTEEAAKQIDPNIDTLTLGKNAGDTFESVSLLPSRLKVTSLIDSNYNAIRAAGELTFKAKAINTDGSTTKVTLTGTFFLVPDGGDWKIEAFDLDREDQPRKVHTPSASGSDTASPTATGGA
jgi:hypothetical protein